MSPLRYRIKCLRLFSLSLSLCIHCNKTELQSCNCNCFRFAKCPRRFLQCRRRRRRRRRRCLLAWDMACVSRIATTYKKFINGAAARHGPDCSQTYARRTDRGRGRGRRGRQADRADARTYTNNTQWPATEFAAIAASQSRWSVCATVCASVCVTVSLCMCVTVCVPACLPAWCSPVVSSRYRYNCSLQILLQPQTDAHPLPSSLSGSSGVEAEICGCTSRADRSAYRGVATLGEGGSRHV